MLPVFVAIMALTSVCYGMSVNWGSFPGSARDSDGNLLKGTAGATDLSQGALMQLIKVVGDIDDPRGVMAFYENTQYTVDDVILQEVPCGVGTLFAPDGAWSATTTAAAPGDTVYARVFNLTKDEFATADLPGREIGIRDADDNIISFNLDVDKPWTLAFTNLTTEPIPEPASLLFLLPGLAIWGLRRKK